MNQVWLIFSFNNVNNVDTFSSKKKNNVDTFCSGRLVGNQRSSYHEMGFLNGPNMSIEFSIENKQSIIKVYVVPLQVLEETKRRNHTKKK